MARLSWHEALLDEDEDRAQVRAARIRRLAAGDAAPNAVEAAGVQRLDVLDDRAAKACVLETAQALQAAGWALTTVPVDSDGLVDPDTVAEALRDDTAVVAVMMANNEIGTVQPVPEIGAVCRMGEVPYHVDAAQAVGKMPIDVEEMAVDFMSVSSHKLYGPQGVGALFCRTPVRDRLRPILSGGGQERGLRPGTLALALVAGFGEACRIAAEEMTAEAERLTRLRDRLLNRLREKAPPFVVNGSLTAIRTAILLARAQKA